MTDVRRTEDGLTLIELLIAMMVMSLALTVLLGGMVTTVTASGLHKQQAMAEVELRNYAELVKKADYRSSGDYSGLQPDALGFTTRVVCSDPFVPHQLPPRCPQGGLQLVTITVLSTDLRVSELVQLVKRP